MSTLDIEVCKLCFAGFKMQNCYFLFNISTEGARFKKGNYSFEKNAHIFGFKETCYGVFEHGKLTFKLKYKGSQLSN